MKISIGVFISMLLISISTYVASHEDITSFMDLFGNVQHFFGLVGGVGAVLGAYLAKSPRADNKVVDQGVN